MNDRAAYFRDIARWMTGERDPGRGYPGGNTPRDVPVTPPMSTSRIHYHLAPHVRTYEDWVALNG